MEERQLTNWTSWLRPMLAIAKLPAFALNGFMVIRVFLGTSETESSADSAGLGTFLRLLIRPEVGINDRGKEGRYAEVLKRTRGTESGGRRIRETHPHETPFFNELHTRWARSTVYRSERFDCGVRLAMMQGGETRRPASRPAPVPLVLGSLTTTSDQ